MRRLILLVLAVSACSGGAKPETAVDPARGLRKLTTDDPDVSAIAMAAAQALPPASKSASTPAFAGVYVDGRRSKPATDAVVRATGYTAVSAPPRSASVQCRAVSSSGQSRTIPCPPQAMQALPTTFTFDEIRATADSAYVGFTESDETAGRTSCMTLVRRVGGWRHVSTVIIADPKRCGR